eukprot:6177917-Amphidinium_carterae.1
MSRLGPKEAAFHMLDTTLQVLQPVSAHLHVLLQAKRLSDTPFVAAASSNAVALPVPHTRLHSRDPAVPEPNAEKSWPLRIQLKCCLFPSKVVLALVSAANNAGNAARCWELEEVVVERFDSSFVYATARSNHLLRRLMQMSLE